MIGYNPAVNVYPGNKSFVRAHMFTREEGIQMITGIRIILIHLLAE
jgi:hypothetical protein